MSARAEHSAFIGLGSNLSCPDAQVHSALAALDRIESTRVRAASSLYRSAPVGIAEQPEFVNAVARVTTSLEPRLLLQRLLALEVAQGRVRTVRNGPRTLDLDLLLFGSQCIDQPGLVVPHPRMHERAFVLIPLFEIAPDLDIPGHGRVADLIGRIGTRGVVRLSV
jgi:2-amino-4-hydroxy-6-hydroxymethyldihydropteridine diphosphokinase